MAQRIRIEIPESLIKDFCHKWGIREFALFGSVLRDDFRDDSDVDVMVQFDPEAHRTLFDLMEMQDELREVFGREVDILTRRGVEQSRNYIRKKEILSTAEVIYAA